MKAVFANQKIDGGGNQSPREIAEKLDYDLIDLNNDSWKDKRPTHQIWYMNDDIYNLQGRDFEAFKKVLSYGEDIKIVLNFVLGGIDKKQWPVQHNISKIIFLNHEKETEWRNKVSGRLLSTIKTDVVLPPINIDRFKDIDRKKSEKLRIGRHSRLSLKYPDNPCSIYRRIDKKNRSFSFMLMHPKIKKEFQHFKSYGWNEKPVEKFLEETDIYLAFINERTKEQAGRSNMEAMAAGCCVIVEDRDGPKEYIDHGNTGFRVKSEGEAAGIIDYLDENRDILRIIGENAKKYAFSNFNINKWKTVLINKAGDK